MYRIRDWSIPCIVTEGGVYATETLRLSSGQVVDIPVKKMVLERNNLWRKKEDKNANT